MEATIGKGLTELLAYTGLFFICIALGCILFPFINWVEIKMIERKLSKMSRMRCANCGALTRGFKPFGECTVWSSALYCSRCGASMSKKSDEEVA